MKLRLQNVILLGVLSTEIYEMLHIPYYRCSFNNHANSSVNHKGFCFNDTDSDKIRATISLNGDMFSIYHNIHHGVSIFSRESTMKCIINGIAIERSMFDQKYVIFYDDSFFKAHPEVFQLSDEEIILNRACYTKNMSPIQLHLLQRIPDRGVVSPFPYKCKKIGDTTVVAFSKYDNEYFFLNFDFKRQWSVLPKDVEPVCEVHDHSCGDDLPVSKHTEKPSIWVYTRKFDTKEEADKMMEIFQFYRF